MVSKQAFNLEDGSVLKDLKDFFAVSENTQNEDPSNNIIYYNELLDEDLDSNETIRKLASCWRMLALITEVCGSCRRWKNL